MLLLNRFSRSPPALLVWLVLHGRKVVLPSIVSWADV
jgi:hypothetical protein